MTGGLGALIAGLFATNIGGVDVGGLDGWRFAFLLTGVLSFIVGLMVLQVGPGLKCFCVRGMS